MITWIQTFFTKHNKWLFSALLVVIIVTFVLTIGNQSFFGGQTGPRQADTREYYGYNLNNPADMERIFRQGELSAMLYPELGVQGQAVQQYAVIRVAALGLANEMGIAQPSGDQVRKHLEQLEVFQSEETGTFDPELYAQYRDFISARVPDGERMLARVLREDFRIAQVRNALAGPGYVVPAVIEEEFAHRETTWQIQLAERSYNDFRPELNATEEDLETFYQNDPARFQVPERIRVSAVQFSDDRFMDAVEAPSESDLQAYFNRHRFRYQPQPAEDETEAPEVTLADVREQVATDFRRERAQQHAQRASDTFLTTLYEQQIERDSPAFNELLQQFGGRMEPLPPYSRNNPPRQRAIPVDIFRSMWIYTTGDRYYSDLAPTPDGAALLVFEEEIPAHIPPFDEIRSQVQTAWNSETRRRLFSESARQWEEQIRAAVAAGVSFEEAAAEAGFTVNTPDAFSGIDAPSELFQYQLADDLRRLNKNQLSPVVISQAGAAAVFVLDKNVPPIDRTSEAFTTFLQQELDMRRQTNGWAALSAWTDRTLAVVSPEMSSQG